VSVPLERILERYGTVDWRIALDAIAPSIHEVDRNATRIWFQFFPLTLADAVSASHDAVSLERALRLEGVYRLAEQAEVCHRLLYGHRYWPEVTATLLDSAATDAFTSDLAAAIRELGSRAARTAGADVALLLGITAVGLMTMRQIGGIALGQSSTPHERRVATAAGAAARTTRPDTRAPDAIAAARQQDDRQGLLGMFRGPRARHSVIFDEHLPDARFTVVNQQHLTTAAALDTRAHASNRGVPYAGPIPAQCRSGSCGTCWIGVLGGAEKLSPVERLEARRLRECGYIETEEGSKPVIRLACMARASGNVTIAIPPWNGFVGTTASGSPSAAKS
jgi:ferredoxin